ncbi:hypothetical protein GCM10027423_13000 [Spirosoma arcticum]
MRIHSFKRFAVGFVAVLLLVAGYYWIQPAQETSATEGQPAVALDTSVAVTELDTSAIDTASVRLEAAPPKLPIAPAPTRTTKAKPVADEPVASDQESAPAKTAEKPVPPPCDQLVMRNGDLIDAKILEVGVDEIRYKRCNHDDGPDYVVSKSDALSIRFANGDIERFPGR